jgi:hypothetical protein
MSGQVKPAVHGLGAHLQFDEHGLSPYWGVVSVFDTDLEGERVVYAGEDYHIQTASYWEGKIAPPDDQDLDGGLYEYKLGVWSDDGPEDKGADFTFRPGYPDATHVETGEPINGIPDDLPECIRVQVQSTNLNRLDVLSLLKAVAREIDLNPDYFTFEGIHEWSTIYQLECYLRVKRSDAQDHIVGHDGLLPDIAQFSAGRGKGEHKWDHEEITGHYEAVALDPDGWDRLIDGHEHEQRLKCYQPQHPRAEDDDHDPDEDDPLYHHKLEAQFWRGYEKNSISWSDYDAALQEFRSTLLHALSWAGLPTTHTSELFVEDPYFEPEPLGESIHLQSNPIPEEMERSKRHARDGLVDPDITPAEFDVLEALRDYGAAHYETLANISGRSKSSVYRAVEQFSSILSVEQGIVEFRDDVIRQEIDDVIHRFKQTASDALDTLHDVVSELNPLDDDSTSDDGEPGPLARWINRHPLHVESSRGRLKFEFEQAMSRQQVESILREGLQAAELSGMLTEKYEQALVHWRDRNGNEHPNWQVVPNSLQDGGEPVVLGRRADHGGTDGLVL